MKAIAKILEEVRQGNERVLARCITMVENEWPESEALLLASTPASAIPVIGITGPPGAGKSTLVNALLKIWTQQGKRIAVLSVDPSSPFNYGALLGDRIRMNDFYLHPNVFIRSMASRGSLGGLCRNIIEVVDILKLASFDLILVETVGVGQSEVEIAGLADTTLVVTVPEAGDEVQTMKAGVMEIADIFVVNKGDRQQADVFVRNLKQLAHEKAGDWEIPVVKCIASTGYGIEELCSKIEEHQQSTQQMVEKRIDLLTEKAYRLIQDKRMKTIRWSDLQNDIRRHSLDKEFNLYKLVNEYAVRD